MLDEKHATNDEWNARANENTPIEERNTIVFKEHVIDYESHATNDE